MPIYECSRQLEAILTIEAEDIQALKRKLQMTADDLAETAEGVAFATPWLVQESGGTQLLEIEDKDIEDALEEEWPLPDPYPEKEGQ